MTLLAAGLGLLVGITLGLLGAGGSILTVPIFIYVLGIPTKEAIAMSLAAIGATSAVGAMSHWRHGWVDLRVAAIFGVFAMTAAFAGARAARFIPEAVQLTVFGIVVLTAAVLMLRNATKKPDPAPDSPGSAAEFDEPSSRERGERKMKWGWIAAQGLVVGTLTAIIGVGGGFLIVPALVLLGRLSMHRAVGTSLVIITMNALSGFAGYLGQVPIDWYLVVGFAATAGVGILIGGRMANHVSQRRLKQAFAVMLLVVGAYVLYRQ